MSANNAVNRLKALTTKQEELKRDKPSEAVLCACDIVLSLTKNTGSTFADHAQTSEEKQAVSGIINNLKVENA